MTPPRAYRDFAEFERDFIKPNNRVGQTFEDLVEDAPFEAEFDFDRDPLDDDDA